MVGRFDHFEVPAAEVVPEEFIQIHEGFRDTIGGEVRFDLTQRLGERLTEPFDCQAVVFALCQGVVDRPAVDQSVGIPDFVAEIASLFAESLVEHYVVAR